MRQNHKFHIKNTSLFKKRLLEKSRVLEYFSILDSNNNDEILKTPPNYIEYDLIAGLDMLHIIKAEDNSYSKLKLFHSKYKDWMFGFLSYDLKNETEELFSKNFDGIESPNLYFFVPRYVLILKNKVLEVHTYDSRSTCKEFLFNLKLDNDDVNLLIPLKQRETKKSYVKKINKIKEHIKRGDIYEMNYCQEFFANDVDLNTQQIFFKLNNKSNSPFSSFMKLNEFNIICSSPERYIKKSCNYIISQPIKGTGKRGDNKLQDRIYCNNLKNSKKDISENIMIVDLVRNDLSVTASKKSVEVIELCKVYKFKGIHQMISTIKSRISKDFSFVDLLKTTFPMGSMTGAPKIRAMQLIEYFEEFKRGIFSGSCGYITPEGDLDFNVIIRSIIYNNKKKYLSLSVGGAITINSDPYKEYEECLLKAKQIFEVLDFEIYDR